MRERATSPSLGIRGAIGLAGGLAAGAAIAASGSGRLVEAATLVELAGRLFINAILMTIVPLVFSKLFVSIAGGDDARVVGRAGVRTAIAVLGLLAAGAAAAAVVMPAVFSALPIDGRAAAALREGVSRGAGPAPLTAEWVLETVPRSAVRAASDGAMIPLVVFAAAFALGARHCEEGARRTLVAFFRAVDSAMTVLLGWVVALSPYGVFALAVGMAARVGGTIVSALGYYVAVSAAALVVATAALYVVAAVVGRISPRRFASACAPAQVVAFSTHSSAASMPAMMEGARRLNLPETSTGFVLPVALAVFKYSAPVWFLAVTFFVGRLYGVPIEPARIVPIALVAVVTSFAVGGVPSGAAVVTAPVLAVAGLPAEAAGLLIAVDPVPNAFRTVANVTGMLAVAAMGGGVPPGGRVSDVNEGEEGGEEKR